MWCLGFSWQSNSWYEETGITDNEKSLVKNIITENFYKVATDRYPCGLYALMDYVHFKGEGVLSTETINGAGWGLRQVLEQMNPKNINQERAIQTFVKVAKRIYPDRNYSYAEKRYDTYRTFNPDKVK